MNMITDPLGENGEDFDEDYFDEDFDDDDELTDDDEDDDERLTDDDDELAGPTPQELAAGARLRGLEVFRVESGLTLVQCPCCRGVDQIQLTGDEHLPAAIRCANGCDADAIRAALMPPPAPSAPRELTPYEAEVKRRLDDLKADATARRLFAESQRPPGAGLATKLLTRSALRELAPPEPLIADTLDRGTVAYLYGKHGSYKSFIGLDWALSVATGRPWQRPPGGTMPRALYRR
jgi:hypothetical protein